MVCKQQPVQVNDPDGREGACITLGVSCFDSGGTLAKKTIAAVGLAGLMVGVGAGGTAAAAFMGTAADVGVVGATIVHTPEIAAIGAAGAEVAATVAGAPGPMQGPSPKINIGQQGKHIVGHNNYSEGKSILTANPRELGRHAGTGQQVGKIDVGLAGSKERVNFGAEIGSSVEKAGNSSTTTNGIIHYGNNGIHIVPSRPDP